MTSANLLQTEAQVRATHVSDAVLSCSFNLSEQPVSHAVTDFAVAATISFTAHNESTFLDLHATSVESVTINGTAIPADQLATICANNRVALNNLQVGSTNTVQIAARCPYSRAGVGLHRFVSTETNEVFVYSQNEPFEAHRMMPCFDQPDIKTKFTFTVEAPEGWKVVSNAPVASHEANTWAFQQTKGISSYLIAIVAGPFEEVSTEHDGISMSLYCRESLFQYLDHEEFFEITKQGLDWYKNVFGLSYPFEKYDQIFCPQFNFGAMENPGCVTFTERLIFRSKVTEGERADRANTILHEMAHMWFGDMVTMQWWNDLWLNESFATFIAHTALDESTRFGSASWSDFAFGLKAWAYEQDQLPTTHPIVANVPDTHSVMANFDGITYAKGSSVVKQLYTRVGRDAFFAGIRDYFSKLAWKNSTLQDFMSAMEKASGLSLSQWTVDWLQTTGVETLHLDFPSDLECGSLMHNVALVQTADEDHPTIREHRLQIGLYYRVGGQLSHRETITTTVGGGRTIITEFEGKPRPDLVIINDSDLTYTKVRLDSVSLKTLDEHLHNLADPVTRAVVWGSLWDGVRDAQIRVEDFVAMLVLHVAHEDDVATQARLLRQAFFAIKNYVPVEQQDTLLTSISVLAMRELALSRDGSDQQLNWVHARVDSGVDHEFCLGLLSGETKIRGLEIEPDLRWRAIKSLAAKGKISAADIEAEYERDNTEIGRQNRGAALASLPTVEAKEQAWAQAVSMPEAAKNDMHLRRGMLRGMWQGDQAELLEPWFNQWVGELPGIWKSSSSEEALELTRALYPAAIVSQGTVAKADEALQLGLPPAGDRVIKEGRDNTLRALKAIEFNR